MMKDGLRLNRKTCGKAGCSQKSAFFCEKCGRCFYCEDGQGRANSRRYCFYEHIVEAFIQSGNAGEEFKQQFQAWRESRRS